MTAQTLHLRLFLIFALLTLLAVTASVLVVLLVTNRHIEDEATRRLQRTANVVAALLDLEKERDLSHAAELAARFSAWPDLDPARLRATLVGSRQRVQVDYLVVLDAAGQVVVEEPPGTTLGGGEAIRHALAGRAVVALELRDDALRIEGGAPIEQQGTIVGAVVAGDFVDSRFLGLIKRSTGLGAALVGGDRLLATTLEQPRREVESALTAHLGEGSSMDRLAAGELVATRLEAGSGGYLGLLVPVVGTAGRTVSVLFLGLPEQQLATRQLDLMAPLLSLVLVVLAATLGVSFLVARTIAAHLQVAMQATSYERVLLDGLEIDRARHEVRLNGRTIPLTRTEFRLLWALAETPGKVVTRHQLVERVWGSDLPSDTSLVDSHLGNLRRKLEPNPALPQYIQTVRGVGFKFREPSRSKD